MIKDSFITDIRDKDGSYLVSMYKGKYRFDMTETQALDLIEHLANCCKRIRLLRGDEIA